MTSTSNTLPSTANHSTTDSTTNHHDDITKNANTNINMNSNAYELELLQTLSGHDDRVWCCEWSPSGHALATSGADKIVRIWRYDPTVLSKQQQQFDDQTDTDMKDNAVENNNTTASTSTSTSSSSSSSTSVSASSSTHHHIPYICTSTLEGVHTRTIRSISWHPSSKLIACGAFDGLISVWKFSMDSDEDASSAGWECISTLEGHENEVKCVQWSGDGKLLASCSRDKSIWIWLYDAVSEEFECISVLNGHTQDVKHIEWLHDDSHILGSASYDNSIRIWIDDQSDDDFYCKQTIDTTTVPHAHTSTVWQIKRHPHDQHIFISVSDDRHVIIWRYNPAEQKYEYVTSTYATHDRTIFTVSWSIDGKYIATGGADDAIIISQVTNIFNDSNSSNTDDGNKILPLHEERKAHKSDVNHVCWHPKYGNILASASDDSSVKIWRFVKK